MKKFREERIKLLSKSVDFLNSIVVKVNSHTLHSEDCLKFQELMEILGMSKHFLLHKIKELHFQTFEEYCKTSYLVDYTHKYPDSLRVAAIKGFITGICEAAIHKLQITQITLHGKDSSLQIR
jgi:hypothetical protein